MAWKITIINFCACAILFQWAMEVVFRGKTSGQGTTTTAYIPLSTVNYIRPVTYGRHLLEKPLIPIAS